MTCRINRMSSNLWRLILLGFAIPLLLLPFTHYHPDTSHSHAENTDPHQHEGRYHSAALEAYVHLINGHFSDHELDDHFHHANSSDDYDESDSDFFTLAKTSKSLKQDSVSQQIDPSSPFQYSNPLVAVPNGYEVLSFNWQFNRSLPPSRSPPPTSIGANKFHLI